LEAREGSWIIINDEISTTPNKENKTLQQTPLPIWFLSFFFVNFLLVSMFLLLDWRAADHIFIASFQRKQLVPHGPSYGKKERSCTTLWITETNCWNQNRNQNISVSFLCFLLQISRDLHPRINVLNLS
jgi:hypothetical protein